MKKFFVILMIVMFTCFSSVFALGESALWALSTNQHVTGILDPYDVEAYMPAQDPPKPYIRGFLDNGLVREKGLQEFITDGRGEVYGLSLLPTKVKIFAQYKDIVDEVVHVRCGIPDEDRLSASDYIMATMYFDDEGYVGHIFFKTNLSKYHVGTVTVNEGRDTFNLYMGDFDFDGQYELGFAPGWTPCRPASECPPCSRICRTYICEAHLTFYMTIRECVRTWHCGK